jgi:hypothetical protein
VYEYPEEGHLSVHNGFLGLVWGGFCGILHQIVFVYEYIKKKVPQYGTAEPNF